MKTFTGAHPNRKRYRLALAGVLLLVAVPAWSVTPVEVAKLLAADGAAGDQFGYSVALSGDTALIGARFDDDDVNGLESGSAYVFTRSGTIWSQQAKLIAADGAARDWFGVRVAISGDTAVVTADADDDDVNGVDSGSVYVFTRSGTTWSLQAKLTAADGEPVDLFGYSVALSGDTAVFGAKFDDDDVNGVDSGSAYVFTRSGTIWSQQAKLIAADGAPGDEFGYSVALAGDTVVVTANADDDDVNGVNSGSAYVFTRSGTAWSLQAKLTAAVGAAGDLFGVRVALSGDTALIGARFTDDNGDDSGSAYVFTRSGTTWSQQAKLIAVDGAAGDWFGYSVALSGDTALIGAHFNDDDVNGVDSGSAYLFTRCGNTWSQQAKLTAATAAAGDQFGGRVAISGDTAVIGARLVDDVVKGVDSGSAYMFTDLLNGDHDGILNDLNNCLAVADPSQSDINPEGA
jgi:hypothetical protein